MNLYGWKYEGRTISDKLQAQIMGIVKFLNNPSKVSNRRWGKQLQIAIGDNLGISDGQVRTIKRMMEEFDILKRGSLNRNDIPKREDIYSSNGEFLIKLFENEELLRQSNNPNILEELEKLEEIYKLSYLKILAKYTISTEDGKSFRPALVLLNALIKFGHLTYWEWYLLNTIVMDENNLIQVEEFDKNIIAFRNGDLKVENLVVKGNVLSHSYILNNFKYVGLINIEGKKEELIVTINNQNREIIDLIIEEEW